VLETDRQQDVSNDAAMATTHGPWQPALGRCRLILLATSSR